MRVRLYNNTLVTILLFLSIADLAILLNIPVMRQICGLILLSFIPGYLILMFLGLDELSLLERWMIAVGLSLSFSLFYGLFVNALLPLLGESAPLDTYGLLASLNVAVVGLLAVCKKTGRLKAGWHLDLANIQFTATDKILLSVSVFFPALSLYGISSVNSGGSNLLVQVLLLAIVSYVLLLCISHRKVSSHIYPISILLISISVLLLLSLRSPYLIGDDIHAEYYFFVNTLECYRWSILHGHCLDVCLSISLFPTLYNSLIDVNPEYLFKTLYSGLYSIVPVVVYIITKRYLQEVYAFIAAFFFIAQRAFFWTAYYPRTSLAVLFLSFAVMILFPPKLIDVRSRNVLFIIFSIACVISHYTTALVFIIIIFCTYKCMSAISRHYSVNRSIKFLPIIVILLFAVVWYAQASGLQADVLDFVYYSLRSFTSIGVVEARGGPAQGMLALGLDRGFPTAAMYLFIWVSFIYIAIGVISSIIGFLKVKKSIVDVEFLCMASVCSALSVLLIVVPFASRGYGIERAFSVFSIVFSTFFVIGGVMLSRLCQRTLRSILVRVASLSRKAPLLRVIQRPLISSSLFVLMLVLLPNFLCTSGVVHQMHGEPYQLILNSRGADYEKYIIHDQDVFATTWLNDNSNRGYSMHTDEKGSKLQPRVRSLYQFSQYEQHLTDLDVLNSKYYLLLCSSNPTERGPSTSLMKVYTPVLDQIYDNKETIVLSGSARCPHIYTLSNILPPSI